MEEEKEEEWEVPAKARQADRLRDGGRERARTRASAREKHAHNGKRADVKRQREHQQIQEDRDEGGKRVDGGSDRARQRYADTKAYIGWRRRRSQAQKRDAAAQSVACCHCLRRRRSHLHVLLRDAALQRSETPGHRNRPRHTAPVLACARIWAHRHMRMISDDSRTRVVTWLSKRFARSFVSHSQQHRMRVWASGCRLSRRPSQHGLASDLRPFHECLTECLMPFATPEVQCEESRLRSCARLSRSSTIPRDDARSSTAPVCQPRYCLSASAN
jgi:hypothetical protein